MHFSTFEATRLDIEVEAKTIFDRVLADQAIFAASEENLRLARDLAFKARSRFEAGDVARLEVMRTEVQVGLAEIARTDAEARSTTSKASLNTILGREVTAPTVITGELTLEPASFELACLKHRSSIQRPDLNGARQLLMSLRSAKSGTVVSLVPDLSLGFSRQTIAGPGGRSSFWRTTLGIEIPVWAPFRQRGEVSAAAAEVRQAEANYEGLEQKAMLEVESSLSALTAAQKRAAVFKTGVLRLAEAAYDAASESYRQGKATYLELLEAQKTLTETRIAYFESIFDYRRALAELERATGGSL